MVTLLPWPYIMCNGNMLIHRSIRPGSRLSAKGSKAELRARLTEGCGGVV